MGQLVFGAEDYNLEQYAKPGLKKEDAIWMDLARNKNYWTVQMKHMYFEEQELSLKGTDFIFDSGMSFGLIPVDDFNMITNHIRDNYNVTWTTAYGYQ